jgi:methylated-DNA-[protein]-cysteine S-methyltransferase
MKRVEIPRPADTELEAAVFLTVFGWVGITWSELGLVAVTLPQPSEMEARNRLTVGAAIGRREPTGLDLGAFVNKLQRYFDGEAVAFDEQLDPTVGTAFQRQVWSGTRSIPRGQTRTYGQIARQMGSPKAARAVGQANAHNPWAIVVPCHRLIGHDGRLTGFGRGLDMKRALLILEGAATVNHQT